ncbi:MAG: hypothetical protein LBR08_10335 [Bacteroidales bacterium]|nr:hypothetical protein [Bacteroidales bacterium]
MVLKFRYHVFAPSGRLGYKMFRITGQNAGERFRNGRPLSFDGIGVMDVHFEIPINVFNN